MHSFLNKIPVAVMAIIPAMCFSAGTNESFYLSLDSLWPLVAKSHVIVTGNLTVPVDFINSCLASNQQDYVELRVKTQQIHKGSLSRDVIGILWYTKANEYSPSPETVISLNGKSALLFLKDAKMVLYGDESKEVFGFEPDEPRLDDYFYFAGATSNAILAASADKIELVQHEVSEQKQIVARFEDMFASANGSLYARVKSLIDASTRDAESQKSAFRDLESLGMEAISAIILLMNDRRNLASPQMSLGNRFENLEAYRHYSPKKVVDAMNAILNQITGQSFGEIYNGGTELQRREAVNGWKVYFYHWKNSGVCPLN